MAEPISIRLEQLSIASPCTASWDDMTGSETKRFCGQCNLHVHNVSAMSREDAEAFLGGALGDGRVCVRMFRRFDGTVLTRDCPVGLARARERARRVCAAVAAMLGITALWGWLDGLPGVVKVRETEPYITLRNAVWGKPMAPVPRPFPVGGWIAGEVAYMPPPAAPSAPTSGNANEVVETPKDSNSVRSSGVSMKGAKR